MKKMNFSGIATVFVALSLFVISCGSPAPKPAETPVQVEVKTDMAAIKAEIQALESAWSAADNARDADAVSAFYADDAWSLSNDKPTIVGKAAILEDIRSGMAKKAAGATVAYETLEVYGDENMVTEIGKSTNKDASGNITSTGKYMAVWEKRDGKYICIRDIYNNDAKEK
jgi:ketosteroid isomerase-like protein